MELFIRIVDGAPFEHPIMGDNFREAFPHIDTENLPPEFARFVRVAIPTIGVYEVYEGASYGLVDGVYTDVHDVRQITEQEKTDKQDLVKNDWIANNGYASWHFDEETCRFRAPVEPPALTDDKAYRWEETSLSWVEFVPPTE
jgi:hypothetical protein